MWILGVLCRWSNPGCPMTTLAQACPRSLPTVAMRRYLRARLNPEVPATGSALGRAAGVSRTTIWRWHQDPEFCEWLRGEELTATHDELHAVHRRLHEKAVDGDVAAARLFLERFDPELRASRSGASSASVTRELTESDLIEAIRLLRERGFVVQRRQPGHAERSATDSGI